MFPDSNESVVADLSQWVCHAGAKPCRAVFRALANTLETRFQVADVSGSQHFSRTVRHASCVRKRCRSTAKKTARRAQTQIGQGFAIKTAGSDKG
jgi:hypothetical protein